VLLVNDGSARAQIREIANDRFGIAIRTASCPLARALADQLFLDDERDPGVAQDQPTLDRGDGDADRLVVAEELIPARDFDHIETHRAQLLQQELAATRRFRDEQRAAIELEQKSISDAIVDSAKDVGFVVEAQSVEVIGLCSGCQGA
jgi:hypothetical protein